MRTLIKKPFALLAAWAIMTAALPASALAQAGAAGDLLSIAVRDFDRDGKIDSLVVTFANPDRATWTVNDASGFAVAYDGRPLRLLGVAATAPAADPAVLEVRLDPTDAALPRDTSAARFELSYAGAGVSAGTRTLASIASGDATEAVTERDEAAPILVDSDPAAGSIDVFRSVPLILSFSEPMDLASLAPFSERNPGQWGFAASADGRTVTVSHFPYQADVEERFGISAKDLAGNTLVVGPYPNPFSFRITGDTTPATRADNVFTLTTPASGGALPASGGAHLAWYTNLPDVISVRLSYSTDAGATYAPIISVPVAQGVHVWYPPNITSAFQLRAEGLNAAGTPVAAAFVSPVSLSGAWAPEPAAPALVAPATSVPAGAPGDMTGPQIVGYPVVSGFDASARTAILSWNTDEPSTAEIAYGPLLDFGLKAASTSLSTSHSVLLGSLTPGGQHQLRITSIDAKGNAAVSKELRFAFLREGDLIKGSGAAVYWYKGGKRYAFPNETVYKTWFKDFSTVITISDTQLAGIPLGGNVRMKEGVHLVKIQTDPKTYAVEPEGVLRWIQTETHARSLYGDAWAARVRDVDVTLFSDYSIGAPLGQTEIPAGYVRP